MQTYFAPFMIDHHIMGFHISVHYPFRMAEIKRLEVKISTDDLIETNQNVDLQKFENIKANIEIRKLWI